MTKLTYPWKGGKQRLNPEQVEILKKIHAICPFERMYCGKFRMIHLFGWKQQNSADIAMALKPLVIGQPKVEQWEAGSPLGPAEETWKETGYDLGANLSLQLGRGSCPYVLIHFPKRVKP